MSPSRRRIRSASADEPPRLGLLRSMRRTTLVKQGPSGTHCRVVVCRNYGNIEFPCPVKRSTDRIPNLIPGIPFSIFSRKHPGNMVFDVCRVRSVGCPKGPVGGDSQYKPRRGCCEGLRRSANPRSRLKPCLF